MPRTPIQGLNPNAPTSSPPPPVIPRERGNLNLNCTNSERDALQHNSQCHSERSEEPKAVIPPTTPVSPHHLIPAKAGILIPIARIGQRDTSPSFPHSQCHSERSEESKASIVPRNAVTSPRPLRIPREGGGPRRILRAPLRIPREGGGPRRPPFNPRPAYSPSSSHGISSAVRHQSHRPPEAVNSASAVSFPHRLQKRSGAEESRQSSQMKGEANVRRIEHPPATPTARERHKSQSPACSDVAVPKSAATTTGDSTPGLYGTSRPSVMASGLSRVIAHARASSASSETRLESVPHIGHTLPSGAMRVRRQYVGHFRTDCCHAKSGLGKVLVDGLASCSLAAQVDWQTDVARSLSLNGVRGYPAWLT